MDGWIDQSIDRIFSSDAYLSGSAVEYGDPSRDAFVDQLRQKARNSFCWCCCCYCCVFQKGVGKATHDESSGQIACTGSISSVPNRNKNKNEYPEIVKTLQKYRVVLKTNEFRAWKILETGNLGRLAALEKKNATNPTTQRN